MKNDTCQVCNADIDLREVKLMMNSEAMLLLCGACHRTYGFFYPLPDAEETALDKKTLFSVIISFILRFENRVSYVQIAGFLNSIKFATLARTSHWTPQNVRTFLTSRGVDIEHIRRMAKGISPTVASDGDYTKIIATAITVMERIFEDDVNPHLTDHQKDIVLQSYAKTDMELYQKAKTREVLASDPETLEELEERFADLSDKFGAN